MEGFKQESSILKSLIGEKYLGVFFKRTREFRKLDEVDDAEETIKTKKNVFEAWSKMDFMRQPEKIKYGQLIHDFSFQYTIKNNHYPKTI